TAALGAGPLQASGRARYHFASQQSTSSRERKRTQRMENDSLAQHFAPNGADALSPATNAEIQLAAPGPGCVTFEQVLVDERSAIKERRAVVNLPDNPHKNAVGLALSGGGLRSASFTLGFLQALARTRFLRQIDYLSTVSGGGYTGAFLTTLFH